MENEQEMVYVGPEDLTGAYSRAAVETVRAFNNRTAQSTIGEPYPGFIQEIVVAVLKGHYMLFRAYLLSYAKPEMKAEEKEFFDRLEKMFKS